MSLLHNDQLLSKGISPLMLKRKLLATLMLTLIIPATTLGSGIYKWTDEHGKVHYGSQRPEDAEAEKMKIDISKPTPAAAKPKDEDEAEEKTDKADAGKDKKAKKERVTYCNSEKKRLKTIMRNKVIHETDANGKVIKLAAEERKQRLNKIRANVMKYCK